MFELIRSDFNTSLSYKERSLSSKVKLYFSPEFKVCMNFRIYSFLYKNGFKISGYLLYLRAKRVYSSDIHPLATIGRGLVLGHHMGIVIGPECIVGEGAYILNDVTIGKKDLGSKEAMPMIGDNVQLGTGAKILGPITLGNNVKVGANAVVINDLSSNTIAVGVPAKEVGIK